MKIGQDHARFKNIVKGKIKSNLKKYIKQGEMLGRVGEKTVSIPVPNIQLPRFRFDAGQAGGVGQGDGDVGDPIGGQGQPGSGKAGQGEGQHALEVEISLDELADILGQELELPNIEPKGDKNVEQVRTKYTGIRQAGPEGLKHFKRTYKQALKRQIASGQYNYNDPVILPYQNDKRFKHYKSVNEPKAKAVIIYMMDVSGSMGDEQKEIVRTESFWIDTWLKKQYHGLERRFIIHDARAKEVDRETFFTTKESGGTIISSAYEMCAEIMEKDYPTSDWNVYPFHFSDGDNWSGEDNERCITLLKDYIIPWSNQFSYGQVESQYGSGQFINELKKSFISEDKVVCSEISNKEEILDSIKQFLGKGR